MVVPLDPVPNDAPRILECLEGVLSDALFFETPKESFDHAILLRCVGRDEFLLQPVVATGLAKPPTLKNQAVVATQDRGIYRTERPEALETGGLDRALGLLGPTAEGELVTNNLPIMTINHGRKVGPAILATRNMRDIHGPSFIAAARLTDPPADSWPRRT